MQSVKPDPIFVNYVGQLDDFWTKQNIQRFRLSEIDFKKWTSKPTTLKNENWGFGRGSTSLIVALFITIFFIFLLLSINLTKL